MRGASILEVAHRLDEIVRRGYCTPMNQNIDPNADAARGDRDITGPQGGQKLSADAHSEARKAAPGARRRFLTGGLAAGSVLTLASRTALATTACKVNGSILISHHHSGSTDES